jgi:hypothetical protein
VNITDPNFELDEGVRLDQVAPGVYETSLGRLTPGAYALRFVQTKPGETPLARTVMLIAPTPAEYRLLGTNERLLAALRGATGGEALDEGAQAWEHDLGTTTAANDLLPWLLLLALVLWPLDVAVRRLSVSRSDFALAGAWTASRWRAWRGPARRTAEVGGMLAATRRAGGAHSRAALLRPTEQSEAERASRTPSVQRPEHERGTEAAAAAPAVPAPASDGPPAAAAQPQDTLARLREAKERARGR